MTGSSYYLQLDQRCAAFELLLEASPYLYGIVHLDTKYIPANGRCQHHRAVHGVTCKEC